MITVIFTCYNRLGKTKNCIKSIMDGNPAQHFSFVILDDASSDGTVQQLQEYKNQGIDILLLHGDGNSYWAGGMRKAIEAAKAQTDSDYYLLVNDDVDFYPGAIEKLIAMYEAQSNTKSANDVEHRLALVGGMCDANGHFTYGGIHYTKGCHYIEVTPEQADRKCDSFNMNCLLLDRETFMDTPNFDDKYVHGLADFDYGLTMKRMGIDIMVAPFYVGVCEKNSPTGGWTDRTLSRRERLQKKENPKGAPFGPWFHFLRKNFGLGQAILHGFTPYIRILLGR